MLGLQFKHWEGRERWTGLGGSHVTSELSQTGEITVFQWEALSENSQWTSAEAHTCGWHLAATCNCRHNHYHALDYLQLFRKKKICRWPFFNNGKSSNFFQEIIIILWLLWLPHLLPRDQVYKINGFHCTFSKINSLTKYLSNTYLVRINHILTK